LPVHTAPMSDKPGKVTRFHWEEFPVGATRTFGAMPVTREATLAFARAFDPQPFHLDDEAGAPRIRGAIHKAAAQA
jgi:acyl dehydratase